MDLKPAVLAFTRVGRRTRAGGIRNRVQDASSNSSTPVHAAIPNVRIAVVVLKLRVFRVAPVAPAEPVVIG